ncbi:hypothetical protein B5G20_10005 [Collinsella sp. An7]|uniref:hypothetical protein n=1 Tax=Collinsella sp. An7 TaxID=1965651 RepID=UPI000B3A29A5|nr:hypothetical protein [Collinsella sp. An7]OUN45195.1 hypothetical protein B5G20_10005 [Collinsella sp. An7]
MFGKKKAKPREINELAKAVDEMESESESGYCSHSKTLELIRAAIVLDDVLGDSECPKLAADWESDKDAVRGFNVALGEFIEEFQRTIDEQDEWMPCEDGKPMLYGAGDDE